MSTGRTDHVVGPLPQPEHLRRTLEWWANPSTLLGSVDVPVTIIDTEAGWEIRAG